MMDDLSKRKYVDPANKGVRKSDPANKGLRDTNAHVSKSRRGAPTFPPKTKGAAGGCAFFKFHS
jgi:hypothetical protein